RRLEPSDPGGWPRAADAGPRPHVPRLRTAPRRHPAALRLRLAAGARRRRRVVAAVHERGREPGGEPAHVALDDPHLGRRLLHPRRGPARARAGPTAAGEPLRRTARDGPAHRRAPHRQPRDRGVGGADLRLQRAHRPGAARPERVRAGGAGTMSYPLRALGLVLLWLLAWGDASVTNLL